MECQIFLFLKNQFIIKELVTFKITILTVVNMQKTYVNVNSD
jgi:hypothetical protein